MSVLQANPFLLAGVGDDYEIERSLRFNAGDSSFLNRTPSSAGNRKTYTLSAWVKLSNVAATQHHLFASNNTYICFTNAGKIEVNLRGGSSANYFSTSNAVFRDFSSFFHLVWRVDTANSSMKIYINGEEITFSSSSVPSNADTDINRNAQHNIGKSTIDPRYFDGYLADVHFIDGQALAPTDFGTDDNGVWQPKKFSGSYGTNGFHLDFADNSSNAALGTDTSGNGNTWTVNNFNASSTPVDTVGATSGLIGSNIVVNRPGSYNFAHVGSNIASNPGDQAYVKVDFASLGLSAPATITFNSYQQGGGGWSLVPNTVYTDAGNTTSSYTYSANTRSNTISIPSGATYFAIPPSWTSAAGGILSNGINNLVWNGTAVNFYDGNSDSLVDSPSQTADQTDSGAGGEVVGNYATLNPLHKGLYASLTNGNSDCVSSSAWGTTISTIGVSTGKWYAELTLSGTIGLPAFGVSSLDRAYTGSYLGQQADSYCWFAYSGSGLYTAGAYTNQTGDWVVNCAVGDVIGLALDMDNGTLKFYKNGNLVGGGNAFTGITGTQFFATCSSGHTESWNFGQRAFSNSNVPSGYKALCTANLPEPTIADGSQYFDTKLYTGSGAARSITMDNSELSPDFVWIKARNDAADHHHLFDTVRGAGKRIFSNLTNAESTDNNTLSAFGSNGFSLGTQSAVNGNGDSNVAWSWDAGNSNTSIAVGGLNSSAYDQSQTWSNYVTGTPYSASYPVTNAFNGDLSQGSRSLASSGAGHTFTPPSAITVNSSLRIWIGYGDASATNVLKVNGTDYSSLITSTGYNIGWITIPGISSITSILYGVTPSGSEDSSVAAIEVDGKILIDSGVSVANVPSIASTVRANPSAGFSIVSYTGNGTINSTVGHGLNAAPEFIVIKNRDSSQPWAVLHTSAGTTGTILDGSPEYYMLQLDSSAARNNFTNDNIWDPTTSTFKINGAGTGGWVNYSGDDYIAYCFSSVEGYSAMGSYVGTNSADGPFVYTGFRPAFVLLKNITSSGTYWTIHDNKRLGYNPDQDLLFANTSDAENATSYMDFLSNGFKLRINSSFANASGATFVYAAFAEHPFKTARAR